VKQENKKKEWKQASKRKQNHALKSPSSCKFSSPPNAIVFAFCRFRVVYIIHFVTQVDQEVDVGKSVCVLKSLEDV
jgi:hypothetical protein